jgi:subtilase family serine protease
VRAVSAWLRSNGITVEAVTPDRMTVEASAPAATVERAFATQLAEYSSHGRLRRLSSGSLGVPRAIAPLISGVAGVDEASRTHWRTDAPASPAPGARPRRPAKGSLEPSAIPRHPDSQRPAVLGIRPAERDTTDPYGKGTLPYAPCGYVPGQLQSAYGLSPAIGAGDDGSGVTVAIVDAYASPTLLSDAQEYAARNQPGAPLQTSQFKELSSKSFNNIERCEANEWFVEQSLDVEAVHASAPGAKIFYAVAKNCERGLYQTLSAESTATSRR